jgi:hypothetical protein
MKNIFTILLLAGNLLISAQPFCQWAKSYGGVNDESAKAVTVDASGNIYSTGYFYSPTITFGSTTLTNFSSNGYYADIFIVKSDSCGNVIWAKKAGSSDDELGSAITTDVAGNVYVAGAFWSSTITFGSYVLTNSGSASTFLVKYNSAGVVQWAKVSDGNYTSRPRDICTDKNGNIYMTGYSSADSVKFGTKKLFLNGSYDGFLVKYDNSGAVLWAEAMGYNGTDIASGIAADTIGNIYVAGYYQDSIKFGSILIKSTSYYNGYLAKYDVSGTAIWAKSFGTYDDDGATDVATDKTGNVYVSGYFRSDSITIGSIKLYNFAYNYNGFLAKYSSGGTILWAKRVGGDYSDQINHIATDATGNIYAGGNFASSSISLDSLSLTNFSQGDSTNDVFLTKYDTNGKILWAKSAGGANEELIEGVATAPNGTAYIAGSFVSASITFGATTINNSSGNYSNAYITNDISRNGLPVPQICMVTVDSLSKNNIIYWDKAVYTNVESFIVYREVSTNTYKPIGIVPYDSVSLFVDTLRTKYGPTLANGDPNVGAYKYKIQIKDSSGIYGLVSPFHLTLFISNNGSQFSWNNGYTIEGVGSPVNNYVLMRDDNRTNSWKPQGSVTASSSTVLDPNYSNYPNGRWRIETQWNISCTPTFIQQYHNPNGTVQTTTTVNSSRSNIKYNSIIGINEPDANRFISVYPNPASGKLNIEWQEILNNDQPSQVVVRNYLGMEVMKYTPDKNQSKTALDISNLASGIYCVEIKGEKYTAVKKLMVE